MPSYSQQSAHQLSTCHRLLQVLFNKVIKTYDCTIIEGHRPPSEQHALVEAGRSKVEHSKHNDSPANAVDAAPYIQGRGIPWPEPGSPDYVKDLAQFYHFAGYVLAMAESMHIRLRWGGDWDRDHDLADQKFDDLVHFELI